jgi:hypothetical protein
MKEIDVTAPEADEPPPFNVADSVQLAPAFAPQLEPAVSKTSAAARMRAVGNWARDTGLGITGFVVVLIVALAGWTASFIGLHNFGMTHMGLNIDTAWLVPITFDGAAGGLSLVVFRASINARGASLWRLLIVVFTALSSWINWEHITDPTGRWIAAFMPPAAVILFEGLMSEARAAAARRDGSERPRVHLLRWFVDRSGTWAIYRAYILGIELPDALKEAAANLGREPRPVDESSPEAVAGWPTDGLLPVVEEATEAGDGNDDSGRPDGHASDDGSADEPGDGKVSNSSPKPRRRPARTVAGKKAPRRSLDEWVDLAAPIFHAEFGRLKRMPTANEFATAIKEARLGVVSDTRAKSIRAEILDRSELPALD